MKKKDIWISLAIIAACFLLLFNSFRQKGFVKIDAGGAKAELSLKGNWFNRALISDSNPREVRRVTNKPVKLSISKQHDSHTWKIVSNGPWGNLSRIKIENNQTTTIRLGPPFTIRPKARKNGNAYSIEFNVIGQAGEHYQKYATRDSKRISVPKLTIVDEQENVLHKGQFQYG